MPPELFGLITQLMQGFQGPDPRSGGRGFGASETQTDPARGGPFGDIMAAMMGMLPQRTQASDTTPTAELGPVQARPPTEESLRQFRDTRFSESVGDLPEHFQEIMRSPFVQDTLRTLVTPRGVGAFDRDHYMGHASGYAWDGEAFARDDKEGRIAEQIFTHEWAHVMGQLLDTEDVTGLFESVNKTEHWDKAWDQRREIERRQLNREGPEVPLPGDDLSDNLAFNAQYQWNNQTERFAVLVDVAMRSIREDWDDMTMVKIRTHFPGIDEVIDYIQERIESGEVR